MENKKEQQDANLYLVYADFEFTCADRKEDWQDEQHMYEVLSIGLVIVKGQEEIDTFYRTVKPIYNPKLTSFCKELTRLTQEEIAGSKNLLEVLQEANMFLEQYKPRQIYVFGSQDKEYLKRELYWHRKEWGEKNYKEAQRFVSKITNIQYYICTRLLKEEINMSLSDCKELLNISGNVVHHALQDARDLAAVDYYSKRRFIPAAVRQQYIDKKRQEMKYRQYRRVKQEAFVCNTEEDKTMFFIIKKVAAYIEQKNKEDKILDPLKAKAIEDDLLALVQNENI